MKRLLPELARLVAAGVVGGAVALCVAPSRCCNQTPQSGKPAIVESGFSGIIPDRSKKSDCFSFDGSAGATVNIVTRGMDGGIYGNLYWRPVAISPDGRILSIGPESDNMGVFTDIGPDSPVDTEKRVRELSNKMLKRGRDRK